MPTAWRCTTAFSRVSTTTISTASARRSPRRGFAMPMLCCSPDFTNPNPDARKRAVDREAELIEVTRRLGGPRAVCRVLSGQRYPELSREQGPRLGRRLHQEVLPGRARARHRPGPGEPLQGRLLEISRIRPEKWMCSWNCVDAIPDRDHFGVQYDPSNAIVAGDDPIALLQAVADRVVSMHASDRYLADGATLDDLRQTDGTLGYSPDLRHGVTGKGLNDYDAIFRILAEHRYQGWVSIEDGMNGMDEMAESLAFLRRMGAQYFPERTDRCNDLRTALIGCGKVGQIHAQALAALPESEFVAVVRRRPDRARGLRRAVRRASHSPTWRRCSPSAGAQAVLIATPHPLHAEAGHRGGRRPASTCWSRSRWRPAWAIATPCSRRPSAAGIKLGVISQRRFYEPVHSDEGRDRRRQDRPAGPGRVSDV